MKDLVVKYVNDLNSSRDIWELGRIDRNSAERRTLLNNPREALPAVTEYLANLPTVPYVKNTVYLPATVQVLLIRTISALMHKLNCDHYKWGNYSNTNRDQWVKSARHLCEVLRKRESSV